MTIQHSALPAGTAQAEYTAKTRATAKPTPNTHRFKSYIEEVVRPQLQKHLSRPQVSVLIDVVSWLEQQRYDYSADRAFQTRPLSNAKIAATFDVTERTVRRWMALLEKLGILERKFRKNIRHAYKNLLNRFQFCGFLSWFRGQKAPTPDSQCPPNKKDIINISISLEKSGDNFDTTPPFPSSGGINYDPYWKNLALKHLPSGSGRPCMTMIAEKFRQNIAGHAISLSHPSITARWIKFCQRAKAIR